MKSKFPTPFVLALLIFCYSCKKNGISQTNYADNFASPTITTPVSTNLGVYAYGNDNTSNPLGITNYGISTANSVALNSNFDGYFSGTVNVDKYLNHMTFNSTISGYGYAFNQNKAYNVSSIHKNYIGLKFLNFTNTGNVRNLGGPYTLNLPGNGSLAFPFESFDSINHIDMNYDIFVNYLDPTAKDFAVSLPNLSMADENGYRWYLNSYGIYQINPNLTYCNCNIISHEDFFEKMITMQMPIPSSLVSTAPDSVEAWHLNMHTLIWEKNGFAYKKNGFYEKRIRQYGVWNFAKPEHAVYLTIQLRTTNGIAIPNTRFVIRSNNNEIAEGRTDIEGNALLLIPANAPLTFNIINDQTQNYVNSQFPDQNLGSFSHESNVKVSLPDRYDMSTLEGFVYKCDGSSFGTGAVVVSQKGSKDDYVVPINNGQFTTANWLNTTSGETKLSFRDANGNVSFEVNTLLGSTTITHLKRLKESFYVCPTIDSLYCNFKIDNGPTYTMHGDVNHASPTLLAKPAAGSTTIVINDDSKGISFDMWILGGSTGVVSMGLPLTVNNVTSQFNSTGNSEIIVYRNDGTLNGFMEGWFAIDYLDGTNAPHTATGNFRLKISN